MPLAATSLAAYRSLSAATQRDHVHAIIMGFGPDGCVSDEILDAFPDGVKNGSLYGRYNELVDQGLIFRNGETRLARSGCQQKVMRDIGYLPTTAVPTVKKGKKNPFLDGMLFAAKILRSHSDLESAKHALVREARKVATR